MTRPHYPEFDKLRIEFELAVINMCEPSSTIKDAEKCGTAMFALHQFPHDAIVEERERLSDLKSERIIQLESALKSILSHFCVSSVAWAVVFDNNLTVEELRELVISTGDVPGFPDAPEMRSSLRCR